MTSGQYIKLGSKWGTTYEQSGDAMYNMIDDFYNGLYQAFSPAAKSMGAATYGDNGYFNAIMGKEITTGMFSSKNAFTLLGAKPYNHEGVRIAYEQADYCLDNSGAFQGIGAGTIQDGDIGDPYMIPIEEFREPYKEVPFPWDYGLGLQALEAKDDVSSYQDYAKLISQSYSNAIDMTLLRPMHIKQPTVTNGARTIETSLQGIARCIGSYNEIGKTEGGVTITADMVSPYGGEKGDFHDFRGAGESVFDGNVIDLGGTTDLDLDHMDDLWAQCSVNWDDPASPNNKAWLMGNIMQAKLSAMFRARNIQIDNVFVERGFNGVKTIQGRPGGTLINAYNNIPMFQDGNCNFDFTKKKVSSTKMGDIMLLDMDHIWMSTLSPVEVYTNSNIAISRKLHEVNVIHCRMETRIDKFIGMGRIIGIKDKTTI